MSVAPTAIAPASRRTVGRIQPAPVAIVDREHALLDEDARWREQDARETMLLAKLTGAGILFLLVLFLTLITILGTNGRTQRDYSAAHPVAPVTRLAP